MPNCYFLYSCLVAMRRLPSGKLNSLIACALLVSCPRISGKAWRSGTSSFQLSALRAGAGAMPRPAYEDDFDEDDTPGPGASDPPEAAICCFGNVSLDLIFFAKMCTHVRATAIHF